MKALVRIALLLLLPGIAAAASVTDDAGRQVSLERPARRIVSLAPHATELLFAAGAGPAVVGVAAWSDHPREAATLPQVGDAHAIDLERVLALDPDLVVAWLSGNNRRQVERLEQAGLTVYYSEPSRLEEVATSLERLGELAGSAAAARAAAASFRAELAGIEADYRGRRPLRVFYEIWHEPPMTLNGRHFVSDALARCNVVNVFAALPALVPTVSAEAVVAARPEAIASGAGPEAIADWRALKQLPASRSGVLCASDPARMHRPGPRLLAATRELCACLDRARR
jgi:iron complex transport system substrate-binding protein